MTPPIAAQVYADNHSRHIGRTEGCHDATPQSNNTALVTSAPPTLGPVDTPIPTNALPNSRASEVSIVCKACYDVPAAIASSPWHPLFQNQIAQFKQLVEAGKPVFHREAPETSVDTISSRMSASASGEAHHPGSNDLRHKENFSESSSGERARFSYDEIHMSHRNCDSGHTIPALQNPDVDNKFMLDPLKHWDSLVDGLWQEMESQICKVFKSAVDECVRPPALLHTEMQSVLNSFAATELGKAREVLRPLCSIIQSVVSVQHDKWSQKRTECLGGLLESLECKQLPTQPLELKQTIETAANVLTYYELKSVVFIDVVTHILRSVTRETFEGCREKLRRMLLEKMSVNDEKRCTELMAPACGDEDRWEKVLDT